MPEKTDIAGIYTCVEGDNWGGIAFRLKLKELKLHKLIAANPLYSDVLVFEGGEKLKIPAFSDVDKSNFAPWRN